MSNSACAFCVEHLILPVKKDPLLHWHQVRSQESQLLKFSQISRRRRQSRPGSWIHLETRSFIKKEWLGLGKHPDLFLFLGLGVQAIVVFSFSNSNETNDQTYNEDLSPNAWKWDTTWTDLVYCVKSSSIREDHRKTDKT